MVTEEDYRYIVDDVYDVDSGKVSNPIQEGRLVANDRFKVISKPIDNTSNGMQAMAVVPINKVTGQVDHRYKYDVIGNVVGNEKKKLFMLYYKATIG